MIEWIMYESIYGVILITAIAVYSAIGLRKVFPIISEKFVAAFSFLVFIISLFTLSSVPMYQFEGKVIRDISDKPWFRIIDRKTTSSLLTPITIFIPPVTTILISRPSVTFGYGSFIETLLIQDGVEMVELGRLVRINCQEKSIALSLFLPLGEPIKESTSGKKKMTVSDNNNYCLYDWAKEEAAALKVA